MPSGTLNMITSGSISDLNCDASTMYTRASAISAAKKSPRNAFCCSAVWPPELHGESVGRGGFVDGLLGRRARRHQVVSGAMLAVTCDDPLQVFAIDEHRPARALDRGDGVESDQPAPRRAHEHSPRSATWVRKRSSIRTLMKYSLPVFWSVNGMG